MRPTPLATLFCLVTAACASASEEAKDLCTFGDRPAPTVMAYFDKTTQAYRGEIDVDAFAEETGSVASAMARARQPVYRREYRADCRNPDTGVWYPCTKTVEVDLSKVKVIVRGFDLDRVSNHALGLCNTETLKMIPPEGDIRLLSDAFRCTVVAKRFCPLKPE